MAGSSGQVRTGSEREILLSELSEAAVFAIFESHHVDQPFSGANPLDIILELEQLAAAEGFSDIHAFIRFHLENQS